MSQIQRVNVDASDAMRPFIELMLNQSRLTRVLIKEIEAARWELGYILEVLAKDLTKERRDQIYERTKERWERMSEEHSEIIREILQPPEEEPRANEHEDPGDPECE